MEVTMKVRDLMMKTVVCCRPDTNLAATGALMWETGCGILPVVDEQERMTGVLTDRDAFIALTTRNRRPSDMRVGEVAPARIFVCGQDDDIHEALRIMRNHKIHRLPVVNKMGTLEGIVSMDDIVLRAEKGQRGGNPDISYDDVVLTLQAVCAHTSRRIRANASSGAGTAGAARPPIDRVRPTAGKELTQEATTFVEM
jgi:CBS domain-containing protein